MFFCSKKNIMAQKEINENDNTKAEEEEEEEEEEKKVENSTKNSTDKPTKTTIFSLKTTNSKFNKKFFGKLSIDEAIPTTPSVTLINPTTNDDDDTPTPNKTKTSPNIITFAQNEKTITGNQKPGYAYIINNEQFDDPDAFRKGSAKDVEALKNVFKHYKLKVKEAKDATLKDITLIVRKLEKKDFKKYAYLVFVILSHGARNDQVQAKDGHYPIDNNVLFPLLSNRTLRDKPKIFFIQACKGNMRVNQMFEDSMPFETDSDIGVPSEILKCYSTFEGYVSYRTDGGSFFIQILCEKLMRHGNSKNIKDILEDVTRCVKLLSESKQIPSYTSTLTRPFVFGRGEFVQ